MADLHHVVHQPSKRTGNPPCLLVIHGWGADEQDLLGLASVLDDRFLVVSPRAPMTLDWGYGWYQFSPSRGADRTSFDTALAALTGLATSLPERYGIDPAQLYVLGFSQGSVMGSALAVTTPGLLRGSVLLSGRMAPVEGRLDGFPVFLGHGRNDPLIPVDDAVAMEHSLTERGADLTFKLYDYGHEISMETVSDVNAWLAKLLPDAG